MPPNQDTVRITRDLHYLTQGLRIMLWQFNFLTPIYTRLKAAHDLKNVVKEMIPPMLAFYAEVMGQEWSAPRLSAGTREIYERLERECREAGVSTIVSQSILGERPMALDFLEFMTQRNIVGIFQKGENNFLLIFRNVEGSLKLAYLLTTVIGEKMRMMEIPQRISYDSKKPAILQGPKGKGRGKGQDGNKGRGKGKGNKGGNGKARSRSPRQLGPIGAAPPAEANPPAEPAGVPPPQASGTPK
jgi:hypothetical protein